MKKYKITTKLRKGIKDIQGDTISLNVNANGWQVENMKVGQVFYILIHKTYLFK